MRTHTYLQYTSKMRTHTCILRKKCSSTFFQNVINRRSTTRDAYSYVSTTYKQDAYSYASTRFERRLRQDVVFHFHFACELHNVLGQFFAFLLVFYLLYLHQVLQSKAQRVFPPQGKSTYLQFQIEIAKSYQPPSEIILLKIHFD